MGSGYLICWRQALCQPSTDGGVGDNAGDVLGVCFGDDNVEDGLAPNRLYSCGDPTLLVESSGHRRFLRSVGALHQDREVQQPQLPRQHRRHLYLLLDHSSTDAGGVEGVDSVVGGAAVAANDTAAAAVVAVATALAEADVTANSVA